MPTLEPVLVHMIENARTLCGLDASECVPAPTGPDSRLWCDACEANAKADVYEIAALPEAAADA